MASIIALDFEGTGLLKKDTEDPHVQPGIVEIGMIRIHEEELLLKSPKVEKFSMILDPEAHFEEKAQEITGISVEDTYKKPNFREAFAEMSEFVFGTKHLITFNGSGYDIPLLQFTLKKYGLETRFPWPPFQHDLMKIATDVLNLQGKTGNKYPSLMELHVALFEKEFDNAHRAVEDAWATMKCAIKLHREGYLRI